MQCHRGSAELFRRTGDHGGLGYTLSPNSWTCRLMGDFDAAIPHAEAALDESRQVNHQWGIGASLGRMAHAHLDAGHPDVAAGRFRECLGRVSPMSANVWRRSSSRRPSNVAERSRWPRRSSSPASAPTRSPGRRRRWRGCRRVEAKVANRRIRARVVDGGRHRATDRACPDRCWRPRPDIGPKHRQATRSASVIVAVRSSGSVVAARSQSCTVDLRPLHRIPLPV